MVQRCEPDLVLVPCFGEQGVCAIEPDCVLQTAMQGALTAFLKELNRYTLADLIAPRRKLAALLGLPGAAPVKGSAGGRQSPRSRPRAA